MVGKDKLSWPLIGICMLTYRLLKDESKFNWPSFNKNEIALPVIEWTNSWNALIFDANEHCSQ